MCYSRYAEPGTFCSLFSTGINAINILIITHTHTHTFFFKSLPSLWLNLLSTSIFLQEPFCKRGCGWDFSLGKGLFCHWNKVVKQKYACVLTFSVLGCRVSYFGRQSLHRVLVETASVISLAATTLDTDFFHMNKGFQPCSSWNSINCVCTGPSTISFWAVAWFPSSK